MHHTEIASFLQFSCRRPSFTPVVINTLANMEELGQMRVKKKVRLVSDRRRSSLGPLGDRRSSLAMESVVEQVVLDSQGDSPAAMREVVTQLVVERRKTAALEDFVLKIAEGIKSKKMVRKQDIVFFGRTSANY